MDNQKNDSSSQNKNGGRIAIMILCAIIISINLTTKCSNSSKSTHERSIRVEYGKSYNSSYDKQIEALKRDIKKSDYTVFDEIAIYDDNCDTVAVVSYK